ncbi:MAG: transcriptional regulator, partial [Kiloniellales bacterium]
GTGLQQVTCLIDRMGSGISHAIGTGGRDLHREVGGTTMRQGLNALADDPETRVIVIVSKPPAPEVAQRILAAAAFADKPVGVNFLGVDPRDVTGDNLYAARTLEEAAVLAVCLDRGSGAPQPVLGDTAPALSELPRFGPAQRFVRGLFSGGTFCYEALLLLTESLGDVRSNTPLDSALGMPDVWRGEGHSVEDLGDDRFTRGRPHPIIDHRLRNDRIVQESEDPETAVILLDVVLGFGAHPEPAAEMLPAIAAARERADALGGEIAFVASVCGTDGDSQGLGRQEALLRDGGVLIAPSNRRAALLAAALLAGE